MQYTDSLSDGSRWRREIAQQVGVLYAENPSVAAVIVGGSTARGHADRFSDIEIGVFWQESPSDTERQIVIERANADLIRLYPFDPTEEVWCDDFTVGRNAANEPRTGILVEAVHYRTEFIERVLTSVLQEYDPDPGKLNLISGIVDGIPFHGQDCIAGWKARTQPYPDDLALAVVRRHALIDHFWRWEMFQHRGDNRMMLYAMFAQVEQKLLHLLLALNHVYYFGFKWRDVIYQRLTLAPDNLALRLPHIYHAPVAEAAADLTALVEETYNLLETHLPGIDREWLNWVRRVFHYRRPIWEESPLMAGT